MATPEPRHPLIIALVKARCDAGLTQAQVAERMGRYHSTIGNFEAGIRSPRLALLAEWAEALELRLTLAREVPRG